MIGWEGGTLVPAGGGGDDGDEGEILIQRREARVAADLILGGLVPASQKFRNLCVAYAHRVGGVVPLPTLGKLQLHDDMDPQRNGLWRDPGATARLTARDGGIRVVVRSFSRGELPAGHRLGRYPRVHPGSPTGADEAVHVWLIFPVHPKVRGHRLLVRAAAVHSVIVGGGGISLRQQRQQIFDLSRRMLTRAEQAWRISLGRPIPRGELPAG